MAGIPSLRLVYMGTAAFAVPSLRALATGPHEVLAVYTQPARPAGRPGRGVELKRCLTFISC